MSDLTVVLDPKNPRTYRDTLTGFEGVATARTQYLYGCTRVLLETGSHDGKEPKLEWFDEQRLVDVISQKPVETLARTGGPGATPPTRDPK